MRLPKPQVKIGQTAARAATAEPPASRAQASQRSGVVVERRPRRGRVRLAGQHVAALDLVGLERLVGVHLDACPRPAWPGRCRRRRPCRRTARRRAPRAPPRAPPAPSGRSAKSEARPSSVIVTCGRPRRRPSASAATRRRGAGLDVEQLGVDRVARHAVRRAAARAARRPSPTGRTGTTRRRRRPAAARRGSGAAGRRRAGRRTARPPAARGRARAPAGSRSG